jgi:hypothetical protein
MASIFWIDRDIKFFLFSSFSFTWYGLVEGILDKSIVVTKEGGLSSVRQQESWVGHRAHTYLNRPNREVANIRKQCFGSCMFVI